MAYEVEIIGSDERDELFERYRSRYLYSPKCDLHGVCLRLLTDQERTKDYWEDNFYAMSENIRSHGRLVVLDDPAQPFGVKYDPLSRTAFLFNFDYYGWVKSVALSLAGDFLEDEAGVFSVHGACLDVGGRGVSLIAPSKTGKTTHSWGLLRMDDARLITDDWYFVQLSERRPLAYGSEKNFYVEGDIAGIWPEYQGLVDTAKFDNKGRAIVNVRWTVGQGGVAPMAAMYDVVMLKRDKGDPRTTIPLEPAEALDYLVAHDFCNPHQLVRSDRKLRIRTEFFRKYFERCRPTLVNTAGEPLATQEAIRALVSGRCRE